MHISLEDIQKGRYSMTLSATQTFIVIVFIMGVTGFVLLASSAFIGNAAAQVRFAQGKSGIGRLPWYLLAALAIWFAIALATSMAGVISPVLVVSFAFVPIVVGMWLAFRPQIEALIQTIPTHWLIFLQVYRVAGGVFIFPYMTAGIITRGFALNAGIGDMITGILAIPVAWLVMRGGVRYKWLFLLWTIIGIGDLLVAFGSAVYFGFAVPGVQAAFPITFIPLFLGPPFSILFHLITVRNFWLRLVSGASDKSQSEGVQSVPNQSVA